ncbi:MAG TPA: hypothetical protein VM260_15105, partial [Pirellula sp.]|nr:hypothetical protein [Pirellula sp.]
MFGILNKTQIAICLSSFLACGSIGQCLAQSTSIPLIDTPAQRWLPPPKPFPIEPNSQAKLLSRLREFVLSKNEIQDSDPMRLSNADIQSLKEAMKQFGGNLPDGLSADSLDAIPPDLISKALSNPELLRQAKELADQFRRIGGPRSNDRPNKSIENADQEPTQRKTDSAKSPSKSSAENQYAPVGKEPQPTIPIDVPKRPLPTPKGSSPSIDNPFNQRASQLDRNVQSPDLSPTDSDPFDSKNHQLMEQSKWDEGSFLSNAIKDLAMEERLSSAQSSRSASPGNSSASGSGDANSTSSMDIRKELQRKGFGLTLQKLVEEAQRATPSLPASPQPLKGTEIVKPSLPTKTPSENTNKLATTDTSKRPQNPLVTKRSNLETTPKPPKSDSALTKSLKESSKYLNNLWTQVSKNDQSSMPPAAPPIASRPV